ncbi:MAG: cation diffusion facilitator family transporter, partial [Eggerthellaceae bacterium]|nr:cation diffusion facilitator family transporter [Eggerthellaceae bacterium]
WTWHPAATSVIITCHLQCEGRNALDDYHSSQPAHAGNRETYEPSDADGDSPRMQDFLDSIDSTDPIERVQRPPAESMAEGSSTTAVIAAIIGNILVGIVKFIAAWLSGSQAMVSEGIHSIVDSGNDFLVLFGIRQSKKGGDEDHPFGHGKELYFWTLVVAVLIFAVGGGISLVEGVMYLANITPETHLGDPTLNIVVIVAGMLIEGVTLGIAIKQFNLARGNMGPIKFIRYCKDPSLYTVVLEDAAAEAGLVLAFFGVVLGHALDNPYIDGIASVLIALLLMAVAYVLLSETKDLLIGEGLNKPETREVIEIVESNPYVVDCGRVLSMYMGPHQLLITIDANFDLESDAVDILRAVDDIEAQIYKRFPDATRVFIEAEGIRQVRAQSQLFEQMESEAEEEELEAEGITPEEAERMRAEHDLDEAEVAELIEEEAAAIEEAVAEDAALMARGEL